MAYQTIGEEGAVTSWGSTNFYSVLHAACKFMNFRLSSESVDHAITGLNATTQATLPGLSQWSAELSAYLLATPRLGNVGFVTYSSGGYALHIEGWEWTIEAPAIDVTEQASSSFPIWRSFRPGISKVSGRITCGASDSSAAVLQHLASITSTATALPTLTLKWGEDTADHTLAGAAQIKQLDTNVAVGSKNQLVYGFTGSGAWTPAGTSGPFGSSAFGIPVWSEGGSAAGAIVMASKSGSRTFTGADSFWKRITVRCQVGEPVSVDISVQGTGTLTLA